MDVSEQQNLSTDALASSSAAAAAVATGTDDDGSEKGVLTLHLQEAVLFHENNLRFLEERHGFLTKQLETARTDAHVHQQRYTAAQERHELLRQVQLQQLQLQRDLYKTLETSQERLNRIVGGAPTGMQQQQANTDGSSGELPCIGDDDHYKLTVESPEPGDVSASESNKTAKSTATTVTTNGAAESSLENIPDQEHQQPTPLQSNSVSASLSNTTEKSTAAPPTTTTDGIASSLEKTSDTADQQSKDVSASKSNKTAKSTATATEGAAKSSASQLDRRTFYSTPFGKQLYPFYEFWKSTNPHGLLPLIPQIYSKKLIKKIMDMMALEILSLDIAQPGKQHRRQALQKTCLDIGCMAKEAPNSTQRTQGMTLRSTMSSIRPYAEPPIEPLVESAIDPSIPLCPYELGGVCADAYCPYQHLEPRPNQASSILLRERLPLPPLVLPGEAREDTNRTAASSSKRKKSSGVMDGDYFELPFENRKRPKLTHEVNTTIPTTAHDFLALPAGENEKGNTSEGNVSSEEDDCAQSNDDLVPAQGDGAPQALWWMNDAETESVQAIGDTGLLSVHEWLDAHVGLCAEYRQSSKKKSGRRLNYRGPVVRSMRCVVRSVARLLDGIRVMVHAGRFELALSMSKILNCAISGGQWKGEPDKEKVKVCFNKLQTHIMDVVRRSFYYPSKSDDFFISSFETALSLALMSVFLRLVEEDSGNLKCISYLESIVLQLSGDVSRDFKKTTKPKERGELLGTQTPQDRFACLPAFLSEIHWKARHTSSSGVERALEEIVQPAWDALRTVRFDMDGGIEGLLDKFRLIIHSGYAIHAGAASACREVIAAGDVESKTLASLQTLDLRVSQIVNSLVRLVSGEPLMNLLLPPLVSMSIALACLLRRYERAQERLQLALQGGMRHSELLWSQLLHLRSSLPPAVNGTAITCMLPQSIADEHNRFADAVDRAGVHLHHVSLWGDFPILVQSGLVNEMTPVLRKGTPKKGYKALVRILHSEYRFYQAPLPGGSVSSLILGNLNVEKHTRTSLRIPQSPSLSFPFSILSAGMRIDHLDLHSCNLVGLPLTFGVHFPKLKVLRLDSNLLWELPSSIEHMASLETLHTSQNRLQSFPGTIGRLTALRELHASNNRLTSLPTSILKCAVLETLILSNNELQTLPESLSLRLSNLRNLNVDGNPIRDHGNDKPNDTIE